MASPHFRTNSISAPSQPQIIRRKTLHSVSEVCQNLRRVFRPYLWQRVEVYLGQTEKPKKYFAKEFLRQLHVVTIQDPYLAEHVRYAKAIGLKFSHFYIASRIVDAEINDSTFRPVFVELGRCFSLFPNLHTVKIVTKFLQKSSGEKAMAAARRGFKKSIHYPQIRSAILYPWDFPLLAACPNLESLAIFPVFPEPPFQVLLKFMKGLTALQDLTCSFAFVIYG